MADDPIVVLHKRRNLRGLFGFLTVVWIAVLVRGHGAGVRVVVLFGALLFATVALWLFDRDDVVRACEAMGWRFA